MAMIFQDPMTFLNPVLKIETQLVEPMLNHTDMTREQAKEKALELSEKFTQQIFGSMEFFMQFYTYAKSEFETCYSCIVSVEDLCAHYGAEAFAKELHARMDKILDIKE